MFDELDVLDKKRVKLKKRRILLIPIWIGMPILSIFLTFLLKIHGPEQIMPGLFLIIAIYSAAIGAPFKKIKGRVKEAILVEFMKSFHPEMIYSYQQDGAIGKRIA